MVRRGRRLSLYGRLATLESRKVVCRSCAEAQGLKTEMIQDEDGMTVAISFGDRRDYCEECGHVPTTGVTLHRGSPERMNDANPTLRD